MKHQNQHKVTQSLHTEMNTLRTPMISWDKNAEYKKLDLKCFKYTEHKSQDIENPENNFYSNIHNQCEYYTEDQLKRNGLMDGSISILHFNSRSLISNVSKIKHCLRQLEKQVTALAISETWLSDEQADMVEIEGYNMFFTNRTHSKAGGTALYINKSYKSRSVSNMSFALDNIMECITVEIEIKKSKNLLISCVYRKPGSCVDTFEKKLAELYNYTSSKKMLFVCGDFNIDLLNPHEHNATTEFINSMYSNSLYPTITRPTRITSHSATLIDNIFTNVMDRKVISGILINDTSDHLPVFATIQNCTRIKKDTRTVVITRHKTPESVNSFKEELCKQDWNKVYEPDVNEAYESFLDILSGLYEKHCPRVKKIVKQKYAEKPWITKGIENACKKKNELYKDLLKNRTVEAEQKYKTYKNKLTKIIRCSKMDHYNK